MPRFEHTLEDFYSMALAAKPVLETALASSSDETQRKGLRLALLLVTGVREFAREMDAARARNETDLLEKLSHHLVRSCIPAPGHFRVYRFRTEVRLDPLVQEAEDWFLRQAPDAQPARGGGYVVELNAWPTIRESIETAGFTVARSPSPRRRVVAPK